MGYSKDTTCAFVRNNDLARIDAVHQATRHIAALNSCFDTIRALDESSKTHCDVCDECLLSKPFVKPTHKARTCCPPSPPVQRTHPKSQSRMEKLDPMWSPGGLCSEGRELLENAGPFNPGFAFSEHRSSCEFCRLGTSEVAAMLVGLEAQG